MDKAQLDLFDKLPVKEAGDVVVVDQKYPTDSALEIPLLDFGMQANGLDLPMLAWGSIKRGSRVNRGSWHFYTDDYKFIKLWQAPERLLETECNCTTEVNLSVFPQTPFAVAVEFTYKKRWLARYWQEHGVRVFVDLNVAPEFKELNLVGVPPGWRAYSTRAYAERLEDLEDEYAVARARCGSEPLFLVVGGGEAGAEYCAKKGWIHHEAHRQWVEKKGTAEVKRLHSRMKRAQTVKGDE